NENLPPENLIIAVPKKGRLFEQCNALIKGAGLDYTRPARVDVAQCKTLPVTLVFLPAKDIAAYVGEGNVDVGITGHDVIRETGVEVNHLMDLGFGKCKLCVQAPVSRGLKDAAVLAGGRIVTSFPNLTQQYFAQHDAPDKPTQIKYVSGSVEAACGLGLADAVVDLVETGTTMRAAGLEVVSDVLETEACLISNPNSKHQDLVDLILRRVQGYMTAQKYMMISYNVPKAKLAEAEAITPGKDSPTVSPLENTEMCSVSALVLKKESSLIMDKLHDLGCTGILLFEVANSRM
ncbi:unnamed protein product, partial [Heterosigma akashiwo]